MANERLLIRKITFCETVSNFCKPNFKEFKIILDANCKISVSFYKSFERIKIKPFIRIIQRAKILFECEKLPRRILITGCILIGNCRCSEEQFQNLFEEGDSSYVFDVKVYGEKIVPNISKISGCLKFYVSTENYFYFQYGGTFLPSISDLEENRLQILEQLGNNFHALYQEQKFSDVSLHCQSQVFKAHKNVLSARSKVFAAMFQNPMKESEVNVVEIEDMNSDVLQTLLEFIYCGRIGNLSDSKACDLLAAAEKYDLKDLKKSCLLYLQAELSVANVLTILSLADMYDADLKKLSLDFVCKEFDHLKTTENWKTFQKEKTFLASEVLYNMIDFVKSREHESTNCPIYTLVQKFESGTI